jgi:hypothetical protein
LRTIAQIAAFEQFMAKRPTHYPFEITATTVANHRFGSNLARQMRVGVELGILSVESEKISVASQVETRLEFYCICQQPSPPCRHSSRSRLLVGRVGSVEICGTEVLPRLADLGDNITQSEGRFSPYL